MQLGHRRGVETRSQFASLLQQFGRAIVLDHHVRLGNELALDAADKRVDLFEFGLLRVAEQGSIATEERLSHDTQSSLLERRTRFDHVDNGIGHAETHRDFDGAFEHHEIHRLLVVAFDDVREAGGDSGILQFIEGLHRALVRHGGAHLGGAIRQVENLDRRALGFGVEVDSGNTRVDNATTHVHGDVARTEKEKLNPVLGIELRQCLVRLGSLVAASLQKFLGGLKEHALIRESYLNHSFAYTSSRVRPFSAIITAT